MLNKKMDFNKCFKPAVIVYAAIFIIGIVMTVIFGIKLDINFSGGTRISYSFAGELSGDAVTETVKSVIETPVTVTQSTSLAGETQTLVLSFAGKASVDAEVQQKLTETLKAAYPDNSLVLYDSNSVSSSVASAFFIKSLVAVLLAAVLVVIYIGIRFRKIGGVSAAITAFIALICDVFIAFFTCTVFRLQIDSNFMAVVLTILGYSLNDTIVIYDRVRENRRLFPKMETDELVNESINAVKRRTVITSLTTILAILTIVVVSEFYGLSSLRSFAIPMATGIVSGCISSLFISSPLWVIWKKHRAANGKK